MINRVTLIGNAGGEAEIKRLESGTAVGRFSVATNESYKDKDGNWQNVPSWHNVVVWRELAEKVEKQVKKGSKVYIEGKISYRKYTGSDNIERQVTDIVASVVRLLDKSEGGGADNRFPTDEPQGQTNTNTPSGTNESDAPPATGNFDDLPF